jgi:hypothetical protein
LQGTYKAALEMLLVPILLAQPVKRQYIMTIMSTVQREIMNTVSGGVKMEKLKASGAVVHSVHDVHGQTLSNSCEVKSCGWIPAFKLY